MLGTFIRVVDIQNLMEVYGIFIEPYPKYFNQTFKLAINGKVTEFYNVYSGKISLYNIYL